jgi:hypothetical protein
MFDRGQSKTGAAFRQQTPLLNNTAHCSNNKRLITSSHRLTLMQATNTDRTTVYAHRTTRSKYILN